MPLVVPSRIFSFFSGAVAVVALLLAVSPAYADASSDCTSANRGELRTKVAAGDSATRTASLLEGETLTISVESDSGATVTLVDGPYSPRTLYSGSGARSVSFIAPQSAAYAVRLAAAPGGTASMTVTCLTGAQVQSRQDFISRRNALISGQEPTRTRIDRPNAQPATMSGAPSTDQIPLDDDSPKPASIAISIGQLAAAVNQSSHDPGIVDFWVEGRYEPLVSASGDGQLGVVYLGSDYKLGPDIMIGALAQFDRMDDPTGAGLAEDTASGWMVGPYVSVRFGQGVFFDGRAAWGTTDTGIAGIAGETLSAERRLVTGKLRGERALGSWTFAPSIGLSYIEDKTAELTPAEAGAALPAGQGRIEVLPEVKRRFQVNDETYVEPRAAVGAFMGLDDLAKINPTVTPDEELHMKAEAGVAVGVKEGVNVEAKGGVESSGTTEPDNWSGRLQLNMPLGK